MMSLESNRKFHHPERLRPQTDWEIHRTAREIHGGRRIRSKYLLSGVVIDRQLAIKITGRYQNSLLRLYELKDEIWQPSDVFSMRLNRAYKVVNIKSESPVKELFVDSFLESGVYNGVQFKDRPNFIIGQGDQEIDRASDIGVVLPFSDKSPARGTRE